MPDFGDVTDDDILDAVETTPDSSSAILSSAGSVTCARPASP
jgi:hypothetical protein